jgi:hypothetical protein
MNVWTVSPYYSKISQGPVEEASKRYRLDCGHHHGAKVVGLFPGFSDNYGAVGLGRLKDSATIIHSQGHILDSITVLDDMVSQLAVSWVERGSQHKDDLIQ